MKVNPADQGYTNEPTTAIITHFTIWISLSTLLFMTLRKKQQTEILNLDLRLCAEVEMRVSLDGRIRSRPKSQAPNKLSMLFTLFVNTSRV